MRRARAPGVGGSNGVDVDRAARWFLTGIVVSLINTGLVLAFIEIPGIPGISDRDGETVRLHQDDIDAIADAVAGRPGAGERAVALGGRTLEFAEPAFVEIARPTFLSAHDGVAWVVSQGTFQLWRVDLEGESSEEDLDGIDDVGESVVTDVDVTTDGTLYVLVRDGRFDWRLFRRAGDEGGDGDGDWELASSSDLTGLLADVVAVGVADTGAVYLSSSDPPGLFRMEPPLERVIKWVAGPQVLAVDAAANDSWQLYAAPEIAPADAVAQIGYIRGGDAGAWRSVYASCDGVVVTQPAAAAATPEPVATAALTAAATAALTPTATPASATATEGMLSPRFPRDVAIVDAEHALVVDSLNHVVWLQRQDGEGAVVFGVPCEKGEDKSHLSTPRAVAIDGDGNIFISDRYNNRVVVLPASTGASVGRPVLIPATTEPAPAAGSEEEAQPVSTPVATEADIEFGLPDACPPDEPRCEAAEQLLPRAVAVTAGASVSFNINARSHQVAVYGPGVRPADIDTTLVGGVADTPGAERTIVDANGWIAESPDLPFAPDPATRWEWDTTGVTPGTYLVICTFQPYFAVGMYGWVIVE